MKRWLWLLEGDTRLRRQGWKRVGSSVRAARKVTVAWAKMARWRKMVGAGSDAFRSSLWKFADGVDIPKQKDEWYQL